MKFLFILLIPFLVSINSISNENKVVDRIKCCEITPERKEEYFAENYKYIKSMRIDMAHKRRDKIEYTLVADENDELKYITEFRYENTNNLKIILYDSRRTPLSCEKRNIDSKIVELKATIPKKGIYYISFVHKGTNQEPICAGTLLFKKEKQSTTKDLFIDTNKTYEK